MVNPRATPTAFGSTQDGTVGADRQREPLVRGTITAGRDTLGHPKHAKFVPRGNLDPHTRFVRSHIARHHKVEPDSAASSQHKIARQWAQHR